MKMKVTRLETLSTIAQSPEYRGAHNQASDEIGAGGKDGVGQGVASFFSNVVGNVFVRACPPQLGGNVTGGLAETIDSVVTSEYTSNHLKAAQDKPAHNVIDGVAKGTEYMTRTVVHGSAGLIGDQYRGLKKEGVAGFTKGVVSGGVMKRTCSNF
eukprot:scaffold172367_cov25-Cyclotella_meneghiniana.AAC.1